MSSEEKDSLLWALLQQKNSDREKLQAMRDEMFGTSSEKAQSLFEHLFNETETVEEIEERLEQDEDQTADTKQKKPRKRMSRVTSSLPVVKEDKYPEDPEFLAHKDEMIQLASDVQRTVEFVPARYYVKETTYHNFVWKISEDEQKFFSPEKPARSLDRSMVSPSVAAHLIYEKAINGMPINRQALHLQKKGFDIDRQTVNNWALRTSQDYLVPLVDHMLKDFRKLHTVHMDETGLKVLEVFRNGGNSVSNMVVGASGPFEKRQMRIYRFFSGKSQTFVQEVLSDGFTGNLVTDGAACYENWTKAHNDLYPDSTVVHAGCMAHARSKFVEAAEKEAVPLFCQLTNHVEKMRDEYPPSGKAGQAVKYFLSRKESLSTYLKDGEIPIDNNKAERTVKPFVITRKGFLFSDSKRGAEATAASFSVLQSAVDNGLNPEKYLKWVLEKLSSEGLKDSVMDEAVPYSENLPADLYVKKKK